MTKIRTDGRGLLLPIVSRQHLEEARVKTKSDQDRAAEEQRVRPTAVKKVKRVRRSPAGISLDEVPRKEHGASSGSDSSTESESDDA
jgi:hypothetical protein